MVIVRIRFKKGITGKITENKKLYTYICPISNINLGDYVLLETRIPYKSGSNKDEFGVGRIEEIINDEKEMNKIIKEVQPTSYVICKIPVKNFDDRCNQIKEMKNKRQAKYEAMKDENQ